MNTFEILVQARKRIEKPENWIKGVRALDSAGNSVDPEDENAVCFCAIGAIHSVTVGYESNVACAFNALICSADARFVDGFTDAENITHDDVLALFDKAIEMVGAENE